MRAATSLAVLSAVLSLLLVAGCERGRTTPKTEVKQAACAVGMKTCSMYVPSESCKALEVERTYPEQVVVGQPFQTTLKVTNRSSHPLQDVTVFDSDTAGTYQFVEANPAVDSVGGGRRIWSLGTLAPGECKTICISGIAGQCGEVCSCLEVTFKPPQVCMTINAIQPALALEQVVPACQLVCDPVTAKWVVKNVGTGAANNVVVSVQLPEGWTTTSGQTTLSFNAGTLEACEQREFEACVNAANTGTFTTNAVATADCNLRATAAGSTELVKPELSVNIACRKDCYLGQVFEETITVMNGPTVKADNTVLVVTTPPGATVVSASEGGQIANGRVTWNLGTVACGESRKFTIQMRSCQIGAAPSSASVTASCGNAQATGQCNVLGVPGLLLEMVDVCDPVEVGSNVTYRVTVVNQGTADDTNIALTAFLPDAVSYVNATGATNVSTEGKKLTFGKVAKLAPGGKATWDIVVKAEKDCNCRFEVRMTSDQIGTDQPVVETEATRLYQ